MSEFTDIEIRNKSLASRLFEHLGLKVESVPEGGGKTPDLQVVGDARRYLIEVKTRFDDETYSQALQRREIAYQQRSMGHDRWTEDIAREACKQFYSVDRSHSSWWVLWIAIHCDAAPEAMFNQALGSLFGVRQIAFWDETTGARAIKDCLFIVPGVFERHHELDGGVVSKPKGLAFSPNEFSHDYETFTGSRLYREFDGSGKINSSSTLTRNCEVLAVDYDSVDRKNEREVCQSLEAKYNLRGVLILDIKERVAAMYVKPAEDDSHLANDDDQV